MRAVMLLVLGLCSGCAASRLLDRSQGGGNAQASVEEVPVRGFQVEVVMRASRSIEGELLAVDESAIWVEVDGIARAIARADVTRVDVTLRPGYEGAYGIWGSAGTASVPSHGFYMVLTLPAWLLTWIPIVAYESSAGEDTASPDGFDALFQYARWPQGMPPSRARDGVPIRRHEGDETRDAPYPSAF